MSVMPSQGLQGEKGFLLSAVTLAWNVWRPCVQHFLSDDNGARARLAVRCGNPPILLLPPLKIDGSERDPRLSYSTEIALDLPFGGWDWGV